MFETLSNRQQAVLNELTKGMNPIQKWRTLEMLRATDERFRIPKEKDLLPLKNPSAYVTAEEQTGAYRKRLEELSSGSGTSAIAIDEFLQEIETIKLAVTKATGRSRAAVSFPWAKRRALLKSKS